MNTAVQDIIIVGAGFAGSLLAIGLKQSGKSVLLVDRHAVMKPIFRAEKLETAQSQRLRAMGVLDLRRPLAPPTGKIIRFDAMGARIVDTGEQYGIDYHDTVNSLRREALRSFNLVVAEVVDIMSSADGACRELILGNGERLRGRLVILACGYRPSIHRRIAVGLTQDKALRSLFVGFDLELMAPERHTLRGCNEHLDQGKGGIDYLTLFRVGERTRANLSAQLRPDDPRNSLLWTQPHETLKQWFPQLSAYTGDFRILGRLDRFVTSYYKVQAPELPGVVAVGDAFQSANPATGAGLSKVLTDLEVLRGEFLPRWLATGRCDREQLQMFYSHARKLQEDRRTHELWKSFTLNAQQRKRFHTTQKIKMYFDLRNYTLDRIKRMVGLC